ncbi:MAG TPA: KOW motif domain-containing protein [Oligoflexia bacterium]|nr:KOW motif domain-containing protein [Oligoflexia bacterium]HMP49359.1 KOW motif domain-containing protein [Oligoflexia bacterium]
MYTPKLLIHPNVRLKRERALPVKGSALFKVGDFVGAHEDVLVTELKGDLSIVKIAERLGISPDEAMSGVLVKEGQELYEGDLIFRKKGLFGFFEESVFSPVSGVVEFISKESSHIGIRSKPERLSVSAYLPGTVSSVTSDRVVEISSRVGVLQGVFGKGAEGFGVICFLPVKRDQIIEKSDLVDIDNDLDGVIVAGGASISEEAFSVLCERRTLGIVTASLSSRFVRGVLGGLGEAKRGGSTPVVMITEGFGFLPMSEKAFAILKNNDGKKASISGKTQVRAGAIRPELIFHDPDLSVSEISEDRTSQLLPGDMVRVVRGKNFGKIGKIIDAPRQMQVLESGVNARCLLLQLEKGEKEMVALANLESV